MSESRVLIECGKDEYFQINKYLEEILSFKNFISETVLLGRTVQMKKEIESPSNEQTQEKTFDFLYFPSQAKPLEEFIPLFIREGEFTGKELQRYVLEGLKRNEISQILESIRIELDRHHRPISESKKIYK